MKFARYLQDAQAPEWKNAYMNYQELKIQLGLVRAQARLQMDSSSSFGSVDADYIDHPAPNIEAEDDDPEEDASREIATSKRVASLWVSGVDAMTDDFSDSSGHVPGPGPPMRWRTNNHERIPSFSLAMASLPHTTGTVLNAQPQPTRPQPPNTRHFPVTPCFRGQRSRPLPPLHTILSDLPATHAKFFDMLDAELCKVVTFYAEREKEMQERAKLLKKQLNELEAHRQIFHESSAHLKPQCWVKRVGVGMLHALLPQIKWHRNTEPRVEQPRQTDVHQIFPPHSGLGGTRQFVDTSNPGAQGSELMRMARVEDYSVKLPPKHSVGHRSAELRGTKSAHDPRAYRYAKRRLRKAVAEHYRGLEILDNYRSSFELRRIYNQSWTIIRSILGYAHDISASRNKTLNLTGFRKVLGKYGKVTKTPVLDVYMKEKVEPSVLASGAMAGTLLKEMEHQFAIRFEHGDGKRARDRLRVGSSSKTHDVATFRSGMWLGLAIPALAAGSYLTFQEHIRIALPSWNALLLIYSTFGIPTLMALLIGINIVAWTRSKINHVFIFKLNPRLRHDYQEYFQLPSLLLCTLAYAFWFSMAQLGPPMLWPALWLFLTTVLMLNPLHSFMWGATRWWTVKKIAKLGASGIWNVEFVDLWLGDQFCSLVYSLSNLYFIGCIYTRSSILSSAHDPRTQELSLRCGAAQNWGWYCFLGMLPFLVRFVQSLRRYRDSKLLGQLVNAGKYGMGMIQLFFYYYWRHQEMPRTGQSYILFCFASTVNSLYGYAWDVAADWSMCQPYAHYPLLRRELAYESHIPLYYFALVSDLCIRFIWLAFVFLEGTSIEVCTFIAGMLEMLRRVQWNFYRVENKHLCNMEEYRVVRELPLPYHFDAHPSEEEVYIARLALRKRLARLS